MSEVGTRKSEIGAIGSDAQYRVIDHLHRPTTSYIRLFLLLLTVILAANIARGADPPPATITKARIGFGDCFKVGYWTPLDVTLVGGDETLEGKLEVAVPDGDGVPALVTTAPNKPVVVLPGRETTVPLFVKVGQAGADLRARFVVSGEFKAQRGFVANGDDLPVALDANRPLIAVVGRPLGVEVQRPGTEDTNQQTTIFTAIDNAEQFPTRWYGYESLDALILCTADPEIYRKLARDSAQVAALDLWVRLGGRLVLCVGSKAEEVLASDAPLAGFAPGKLAGRVSLKQTNAWETYAETSERLDASSLVDEQGEFRLDAPKLEDVRGKIEAFEGSRPTDLPLVVHTPHGLGEVVFVAADLDRPPFVKWPARKQMLDKLLGSSQRKRQNDETPQMPNTATYGYGDLAGQLRSALEQFSGVRLVPFSLVALLIGLYILAMGPLDFLLLKRVFKRMEWTWFTFPAIVLAFSATAYFLAYFFKGTQLRANQVDVIDFDTETKLVRGTTWTNLFSPRVDSYDLKYAPKLSDGQPPQDGHVLISWMGLPGNGFGGMNAPTGAPTLFTSSYEFSPPLDQIFGMPIAVWSTKGLTARWHGQAETGIEASLVDQGDRLLAGTIASKLDEPLTDCVLVYDRWAYPIGKLDPHARFAVETKLDPQTVETYFKHITIYNEKDTTGSYNQGSLEVDQIVETMMFHQHLGGNDYTKLSNQYQQFIDLSGLLRAGRAILVGRGSKGGAQLLRDDEPLAGEGDRHWVFYRFVFPVGKKEAG